jgi:hypothetical protein
MHRLCYHSRKGLHGRYEQHRGCWIPCLNPRLWWILFPGTPFTSTLVFAVYSRSAIHFRNLSPNPIFLNTSKRKLQEMESKALAKSSFRSTPVCRLELIFRATCLTKMKLSCAKESSRIDELAMLVQKAKRKSYFSIKAWVDNFM